ncbi:hypothetical protein BH18ACT4_BH18ACT4_05670 [soil metagenome]
MGWLAAFAKPLAFPSATACWSRWWRRTDRGRERGVEVTAVVAGSPAAGGGLRPEDIIVMMAGEPVGGIGDLQRLMTGERVDRPVLFTVVRAGGIVEVEVVPSELNMNH